ncbi:MAG: SDR family oxidoreductase [Cellvibrionales bacterium]|nr:SDR family oxidoreductase [Cellvibrionales bacterium]|tara:strand:- start:11324 stop:12199 length:876 start_codon:yes stop_codon:yes gene_type:complete
MQDFKHKLAVITGGASGVGRSLAFALGREGGRVLIADVDQAALTQTQADLSAAGIDAHSSFCDVSSADSVKALAIKAFDELGGAQLVFANAGIGAGEGGAMWEYAEQDWQWAFNVNVWGVINSINAFMPRLMAQQQEAHMVITGSGNGAFMVLPDSPIYTATKASVQAITEALYYQTSAAQDLVKVNALFPGPYVVDTGLFNSDRVRPAELDKGDANDSGIKSVDDMREMMEQFGMELKTTHPDEVAQTALQGLRNEQFWISPMNEDTEAKIKLRMESIFNRTNPVAPSLG